MNLQEVHEYLKLNGYLLEVGDKLVLTGKYQRDIANLPSIPVVSELPVVSKPSNVVVAQVAQPMSDKELYKKFIELAEVPTQLPFGNGGFYWANRYSVNADRIFNKIRRGGKHDMTLLLLATKLYYKSNGSKETISNYFTRGTWESCYDELKLKHDNGTLKTYVAKTVVEGRGGNKYEQGI